MTTRIGFAAVGVAALIFARASASDLGSEEFVPFCELMALPAPHDGQVIRTTAVFVSPPESRYLYDPACPTSLDSAYVNNVSLDETLLPSVAKGFVKLLRRDDRVRVTLQGIFHAPRPFASDPRLPEWLRERNEGRCAYFHESHRTAITIWRIESVEAVLTEAPEWDGPGDGVDCGTPTPPPPRAP